MIAILIVWSTTDRAAITSNALGLPLPDETLYICADYTFICVLLLGLVNLGYLLPSASALG